ncbi:protein-methionine sulfoxide oxidase MICAL2 [Platysternon megacephalum]|uniref:Protein-methionine sulfoxide oxidase MICAL2 n=1 Tax=Platysternon megacephalum TaxID=55544 RepID=A0A4D9DUQ6_9SAUR|nr:protein-methionine sulfoxide oxidase MICAL2 [Platysternon megacephalum]
MASPDAILARLVPTAVFKLQDHVAQKCWEIQMKAFPNMAAHDLQIKHLMEMLSSSRPVAGHVSVCHLCRKEHPGKMKGKKTQEETQVSAELHGLRDITAPHGFDGTVNSKLSKDQLPIRVCKKCSKLRRKRPAGSAGADLPRRSHGIPQRWTPGDSSASSNHNTMPVVWLLPADRSKTQDGMGKTAPTKHPKMVSVATSTTGLLQAGEKATGSPDGSPPKPPKASSTRTPSPARSKVPVLKRILMCLKKTIFKLQNKHTIQELRCHGAGVSEPGRKILIIKGGFSIMNGHGQAVENRDLKN